MSLSILPPELLILVIKHAVDARSFKRALRLRRVNKAFAHYTVEAIFQSGIITRDREYLYQLVLKPDAAWFWQRFFIRRVLAAQPVTRNALVIRTVAHRILRHQYESYADEDLKSCVAKLCHLAMANHHLCSDWSSYMEPLKAADQADVASSEFFNQQLLSAAAYFGFTSMAQNLCEQGFLHYLHSNKTMFPFPLASAAYGGHRELVDLFTQKYPCPTEHYIGHGVTIVRWAGSAGHDDLIRMTLHPGWDHYRKGHCALGPFRVALYETTSLETLREFLPEAKKWIADPTRRPLPPHPPARATELSEFQNKLLPSLLIHASERGLDDIVRYLLQEVMTLVEISPEAYLTNDERPILSAARAGNTATVRLLLESGAIPGSAIEHAAAGGSIHTVRLLLEQGDMQGHVREALKNAIKWEHDNVVMLLESVGATLSAAERAEVQMQAKN